ncbi:hypothetical protein BBD42_04755 [Paenibacillus sp. BIHB 4019]|uniref:Uncharacterized protein n=1 Tax=Paenibacillus sp. BIHB 4019 TaxID=1870819 RepID=A0A1B2DDR2_9BACL|nr:hypothetical protein BBD42_04755 [Paenibacillus sp. BIHB 4019]
MQELALQPVLGQLQVLPFLSSACSLLEVLLLPSLERWSAEQLPLVPLEQRLLPELLPLFSCSVVQLWMKRRPLVG